MISDSVAISIVTGVLAFLSTVFTGVMTYFVHRLEVKATRTQETADKTQKTIETVHTLVNANMGAQLKISAVALRRLSIISGSPDDQAAADLADKLYLEHEAKQAIVDDHTPVANHE